MKRKYIWSVGIFAFILYYSIKTINLGGPSKDDVFKNYIVTEEGRAFALCADRMRSYVKSAEYFPPMLREVKDLGSAYLFSWGGFDNPPVYSEKGVPVKVNCVASMMGVQELFIDEVKVFSIY